MFIWCSSLTKNADIDKYGYSGYGFGQNVLIFGVDMSFSAHIDDKKKDILVLGIGPTQGLEHTLTVEKICSINFLWQKINSACVYITMEQIVICLWMVQKFANLKQKILKL